MANYATPKTRHVLSSIIALFIVAGSITFPANFGVKELLNDKPIVANAESNDAPYLAEENKVLHLAGTNVTVAQIHAVAGEHRNEITSIVADKGFTGSIDYTLFHDQNGEKYQNFQYQNFDVEIGYNYFQNLETVDLSNASAVNVNFEYLFFDLPKEDWQGNSVHKLKSVSFGGNVSVTGTSMKYAFTLCSELETLDLGNIDTSKVECVTEMFSGCTYLQTIKVGDKWNMDSVTNDTNMFKGCSALVGENGTSFNLYHTDKSYACIDTADTKGYLTRGTYDTGENGNTTPDPQTEEADVSLDVQGMYIISIPKNIPLSCTETTSASIKATEVLLDTNQKIVVTLSEASNTPSGNEFHVKRDSSIAVYTIKNGETPVSVGDTVATFTETGTSNLTFSKATGATRAGKHNEKLTFTISVEPVS